MAKPIHVLVECAQSVFFVLIVAVAAGPALGQPVLYVDQDATGPVHDGATWCTAFIHLQDALAAAAADGTVTEIRVAAGAHRPDRDAAHPNGTGDKEATFEPVRAVLLGGGYAGCGWPDPDARDPTVYETILSGDLARDDDPCFHRRYDNVYHVVTISDLLAHPEIDGVTIRGGHARYPSHSGGGVYVVGGGCTLTDCTVRANRANNGPAVYISADAGAVTIRGCTISDNMTLYNSAAVESRAQDTTLVDSLIVGNQGRGDRAGVYCTSGSSCELTGCILADNNGVAVTCEGTSALIRGCRISRNRGGSGAALRFGYSVAATVSNCTIIENSAFQGAAIFGQSGLPPVMISNSIIRNNGSDQIHDTAALVEYSNVEGGIEGMGNIDEDPVFAFSDDAHLLPGSPCIDAGTNSPAGGLVATDLDGDPRPEAPGGSVDMGADEYAADHPAIGVSPHKPVLHIAEGDAEPAVLLLAIRNLGGGTLDWQVAEQCAWLTVDPTQGTSVGEIDHVTLTASATSLAPGAHSCVLRIVAPGAATPSDALLTLNVNRTIGVPADYASIQSAIDAAVDGDTVQIAPGTYTGTGNRKLLTCGKVVTVQGAEAPGATVIDCENQDPAFYFTNGESRATVLRDLTIQRGRSNSTFNGDGGAIICRGGSDPTIGNCIVRACNASSDGAAISARGRASPLIEGCLIAENASEFGASGVYCEGRSEVRDCAILLNRMTTSYPYGYAGAGLECWGEAVADNCVVVGNSVHHSQNKGGGVIVGRMGRVSNSVITQNRSSRGGGVYTWVGGELFNCLIAGNWSNGIRAKGDETSFSARNCTVTGNLGYGVANTETCVATLENCVLWNEGADEILVSADATVNIRYSDVRGGAVGDGNIDVDPGFVRGPIGLFYLSQLAAGQAIDSQCVDAGDGLAETLGLDTHTTRVDEVGDAGAVDIGYHYPTAPRPLAWGDHDLDRDIDLADFAGWGECAAGPDSSVPLSRCYLLDFDYDIDVDLADFAAFQTAFAAN